MNKLPLDKVCAVKASELATGLIYPVLLEFFSGPPDAQTSTWHLCEVVRIQDGLYRRFYQNVEDSYKLYPTYRGDNLADITIHLIRDIGDFTR